MYSNPFSLTHFAFLQKQPLMKLQTLCYFVSINPVHRGEHIRFLTYSVEFESVGEGWQQVGWRRLSAEL